MRIGVSCIQCFNEDPLKTHVILKFQPLRQDGIYRYICDKGHQVAMILQQMHFEVLSEAAVQALTDDYYRDAVATFTAMLERFYEFYWRVVSLHNKIPQAEINAAWKRAQRQSERQLGLFIATYLSEERKAPPLLKEDPHVKLRNNVIHNGDIPTYENAMMYGQAVLDILAPTLELMRDKYENAIERMIFNHMQAAQELCLSEGERTLHMASGAYPFPISLARRDGPSINLERLIKARLENPTGTMPPPR
ncbi:hypothetical protein WDZ92_17525 [Nostoc sp. NIES-2111]